jgi:hypothetical protein
MTPREYRDADPRWIRLVSEEKVRGIKCSPARSFLAQEIYAEHYRILIEAAKRGEPIPPHLWDRRIERIMFENSESFREWFGTSKIVDDEGRPQQVYHGTTHPSGISPPDKIGAIYFSTNRTVAEWLSSLARQRHKGEKLVSTAYLRIIRPAVYDAECIEAGRNPGWIRSQWDRAIAAGHDGMVLNRIYESGFMGTTIMVQSENQVWLYEVSRKIS